MKSKTINLLLLVNVTLLICVGCTNENKASEKKFVNQIENSATSKDSESVDAEISSDSNTNEKRTSSDNYISGTELNDIIGSNENALAIVGSKDSEKFALLLETVKSIAKERNISYFLIDINDNQNKEWLNENNTFGQMNNEMNIGIISNRNISIIGLQDENEYKKGLLSTIVDGIMGKLEELK